MFGMHDIKEYINISNLGGRGLEAMFRQPGLCLSHTLSRILVLGLIDVV